jgi:uncharacterized membrane protein
MNADVTEATAPPVIRVDRRILDRLAARGLISTAARDHGLGLIEPPRRWGVWMARLLTVLGASLVLAGIVYFFAFNWNHIPPMVKLGAIAAMIAAAVATVVVVGFGRMVSDVAVSAAVVLVGVFLAVEGQIHQTGADAWQLFAGWAAATLAWVLLANSAAAWAIWIAVANIAARLWWDQVRPFDDTHHAGLYLILIGLDGGLLMVREVLAGRGVVWPAARWTRFVLVLPLIGAATTAALVLLDRPRDYTAVTWALAATAAAVFATLFVVYRRARPDVAVLSATTIAAAVVLDFMIFQILTGNGRADLGIFLLMGLTTLAIFAGAVAWLRGVARRMEVS